ncbi:MAG: flagellar hook-length control protein FliK [Magnetococcales bacterium]|nr:flagellar hook-length control protein FliK [Magnetococcales bacterium]
MFISGNWVQSVNKPVDAPGTALPSSSLTQGAVVAGRISEINGRGEGVLRLTDGSGFFFSGGQALKAGEQVRLEVVQLQPQVTLRLLGSDSGMAQRMASDMEQSLMRLPDLFARLMHLSGLDATGAVTREGTALSSLFATLRQGGTPHSLFATGKGESLAALMQRVLPNFSFEALGKGDLGELMQLLRGGKEVSEMVRQLRQAALDLQPVADPVTGRGPGEQELAAARQTLTRLGDLLAMQEILPRTTPGPDGDPFLGYRVFWLDDRGLGELIWRRRRKGGSGGEGGEKEETSVLVTLNLTRLGAIQAHLSLAENTLRIALKAEEEESLSVLREEIRQLRQALIAAELPLRSLDLSLMTRAMLQEERQAILELGDGFSVEV